MENAMKIDLLKKCIQIPSENPGGNEREVASFLHEYLTANNIKSELLITEEGRYCVVADIFATNQTPQTQTIGFSGHIDVVPAQTSGWSVNPFGGEEVEGKIYGRGANDMKAGVIAEVVTLVQLNESKISRKNNIRLLLTCDEEVTMKGAEYLTKMGYCEDLDAMIIGEPTMGYIGHTQKGVIGVEVTCYGQGGHSSNPKSGKNAIQDLIAVINEITADTFELGIPENKELGPVIYNIASIKGGTGLNIIPNKASFKMEIRTIPGVSKDIIINKFKKIETKLHAKIHGFSMSIDVLKEIPFVETSLDDEFVEKVMQSYTNINKKQAEFIGIPGATDGAMFSKSKNPFPILVLSMNDPTTAHQVDEYVEISRFLKTIDLYMDIATNA